MCDDAVIDYERKAFQEGHAACFKGRQLHGVGQRLLIIRQNCKRQMQAFGRLPLIGRVLSREAEEVITLDPREEPGALAAHAGICAGGGEQSSFLPRQPPRSTCGSAYRRYSGRWGESQIVPRAGGPKAIPLRGEPSPDQAPP